MNVIELEKKSVEEISKIIGSFLILDDIQKHAGFTELSKIPFTLKRIDELQNKLDDETTKTKEINQNTELVKLQNEKEELCKSLVANLHKWTDKNEFAQIKIPTIDVAFDEVLYATSLVLAHMNPINATDFATLEKIEPCNQVVTYDQYQYDINSFVSLLKKGKAINPYTRQPFCQRDQNRIKQILNEKFPELKVEFNAGSTNSGGDPNLTLTMELVRQLQQQMNMPSSGTNTTPRYFTSFNRELALSTLLARTSDLHMPDLGGTNFSRSLESYPAGPSRFGIPSRTNHPITLSGNHLHDFSYSDLGFDFAVHSNSGLGFDFAVHPYQSSDFVNSRRHRNIEVTQTTPVQYLLPTYALPDWMSAPSAAKLPNGYIAISKADNRGEIQIINPATNEIVRRIQDGIRVSGIVALENGNIAVGHYDEEANINIYNPSNGNKINSYSQNNTNRQQRCMIARGNNILSCNSGYTMRLAIVNSENGQALQTTSENMFVDSMTEMGNGLAVNGFNRDENRMVCVVYDNEFHVKQKFPIGHPNATSTAMLTNGDLIFAAANHISVYRPASYSRVREFQVSSINIIHSILVTENNQIVIGSMNGDLILLTPEGSIIQQVKTNCSLSSPVMLKLAYEKLCAMNVLQAVPSQNTSTTTTTSTITTVSNPSSQTINQIVHDVSQLLSTRYMLEDDIHYQNLNTVSRTYIETNESTSASRLFSFRPNDAMINTVNFFRDVLDSQITLEHLKRWRPNVSGAPFTQTHCDALIHFVLDQQLTGDQAIEKINRKSETELREMLPNSYNQRRDLVD